MAISAITIQQDNITSGANLLAAQSPLAFIANVNYSGTTPIRCNVEIYDADLNLLDTYKAIPYRDTLETQRQFIFLADQAIRALMGEFDEFVQANGTFEYVDGLTLQCYIRFVDPANASVYDEVLIDFAHAAKQFGEDPCLVDQFNNESDIYYAQKGGFVYLYFYNNDAANEIGIDLPPLVYDNALDYDDSIFTDYDDQNFTILTP